MSELNEGKSLETLESFYSLIEKQNEELQKIFTSSLTELEKPTITWSEIENLMKNYQDLLEIRFLITESDLQVENFHFEENFDMNNVTYENSVIIFKELLAKNHEKLIKEADVKEKGLENTNEDKEESEKKEVIDGGEETEQKIENKGEEEKNNEEKIENEVEKGGKEEKSDLNNEENGMNEGEEEKETKIDENKIDYENNEVLEKKIDSIENKEEKKKSDKDEENYSEEYDKMDDEGINSSQKNEEKLKNASQILKEKPKNMLIDENTDQKNERVLLKLFEFYCKSKSNFKAGEIFISPENSKMSLNILSVFLKDFKVTNKNLTNKKIVEIFKKNALPSQELGFENFLTILRIVGLNYFSNENEGKSDEERFQDFLNYLEINNLDKLQEKVPNIKQILNSNVVKKIEVPSKIKAQIEKSTLKENSSKNQTLQTKQEYISPIAQDSKKMDFKKILPNKLKDLYQLNQAKSLINKLNLKKDTTLKKLNDLSSHDLQPFQDQPFNPGDLFEKNTGDDDIYLAEYPLDKKENLGKKLIPNPKQPNLQKEVDPDETVRRVKGSFFPKSKSKSPPKNIPHENNLYQKKNYADILRSPRSEVKNPDYKSKLIERAQKIDIEAKEKEKKILTKIAENHQQKIERGLNVLKNR